MGNVYFDLTREFNAHGRIAVLTSGQAVVHYRVAMMSKDGDWILRETAEACGAILDALVRHGAHYRPGAPLDIRWLAGGWSSHFEFLDPQKRRVRCDFMSRPPRVAAEALHRLFATPGTSGELAVLEIEDLIRMKRTQRAKDYPIIGELARQLAPDREVEHSTDPDRIAALAQGYGAKSQRPSVRAARRGAERRQIVSDLALEIDAWQLADRDRMARFDAAARRYLEEFHRQRLADMALREGHAAALRLASVDLPPAPAS